MVLKLRNNCDLFVCRLLVEYAMTGKLGGEGSKDELDAYLRNIASSVVLKNQKKKVQVSSPSAPRTESKLQPVIVIKSNSCANSFIADNTSNSVESLKKDMRPSPVSIDDTRLTVPTTEDLETDDHILDGPLTPLTTSSTDDSDPNGADSDDDDNSLNPFARDYQPPVDKHSLASSLASLANEPSSRNSSIPDLATYDEDADTRYPHGHLDHLRSDRYGDGEDGDEPDSPVNLLEYECLDMDSIPKYDAFKPSIRSRVQRMNAVPTSAGGLGIHTMSGSNHSLASYHSGVERAPVDNGGAGYPASMQSSFASSSGDDRFQFADNIVTTTATATSASKMAKRRPKRIMDMNYSYDFQREQDYNPFISPPMTFLPVSTAALGDIETLGEIELSHTPKIEEEPPQVEIVETQHDQVEVEEEEQRDTYDEEQMDAELSTPVRLSDCDETEALMAALAAASEDDYNLFGKAHE